LLFSGLKHKLINQIFYYKSCIMKKLVFISMTLLSNAVFAQNVGIGTTTPVEKLDVIGNIKTNGLIINNGGSLHDFIIKSNAAGVVGFRKGHGGLGLRFIICYQGTVPDPNSQTVLNGPFIGEIKIFAGDFAPSGWLFCEGQYVARTGLYAALFNELGTTYGTSATNNFGIPDIRGAVPVHSGTSPAGNTWNRGN
jgi:hypothetical protein